MPPYTGGATLKLIKNILGLKKPNGTNQTRNANGNNSNVPAEIKESKLKNLIGITRKKAKLNQEAQNIYKKYWKTNAKYTNDDNYKLSVHALLKKIGTNVPDNVNELFSNGQLKNTYKKDFLNIDPKLYSSSIGRSFHRFGKGALRGTQRALRFSGKATEKLVKTAVIPLAITKNIIVYSYKGGKAVGNKIIKELPRSKARDIVEKFTKDMENYIKPNANKTNTNRQIDIQSRYEAAREGIQKIQTSRLGIFSITKTQKTQALNALKILNAYIDANQYINGAISNDQVDEVVRDFNNEILDTTRGGVEEGALNKSTIEFIKGELKTIADKKKEALAAEAQRADNANESQQGGRRRTRRAPRRR